MDWIRGMFIVELRMVTGVVRVFVLCFWVPSTSGSPVKILGLASECLSGRKADTFC